MCFFSVFIWYKLLIHRNVPTEIVLGASHQMNGCSEVDMAGRILEGPAYSGHLPKESLGIIFYNEIRKWDLTRTSLIDSTGEEVNYGTLLEQSVRLAKKLRQSGVRKGDVITIIAQNQWKYLVTIIAGFYIGAVANLLNHDYTAGELKHFLAICRPVLIFCTNKSLKNLLPIKDETFFPANVIIYDGGDTPQVRSFDKFLEDTDDDDMFSPVALDPTEDVAFILTSSGTTGLPKCVQLTHSNFRVTMIYAGDYQFFDINVSDTLVVFLPFFHIFGAMISLASIIYGAKFVILAKFIPDVFLHTIQEYKITKLFVVPPTLLFLVKSPLVQKYDLSSIKDVISGAASVKKELEEDVAKLLNITAIRQIYGMTEVCGAGTIIPKNIKRYGSCGVTTTTFQMKVCDTETGKALPPNKIGEIRFNGEGVMKGYLRNNAATENAFDEEGFMRSGDLGYYDDDGYFYIVDRLKEIIKYKGFQVSPAELENLLNQHPAVLDSGVVSKPDERAGEVPVAFVVKQPDQNITEEELISYISRNVSVQKYLYGGVRFIEEIPKNPSGKILRRKLKEML